MLILPVPFVLKLHRHCEERKRRSNPENRQFGSGLLRFARNDAVITVGALSVILLAAALAPAVAGERKPTRAEQLRANQPDPRCAGDGDGFIYEASTGSCVRIGGSVIVQGGRGDTSNLLGR